MILPNINGRSRKSFYKKILTTNSSFSNYISSFNKTDNNFSKPKQLIRNTRPLFPNSVFNLDDEYNNSNPLNRNLSHVKFPYKPQQIIKDNRPIKSKIIKKNKNNIEIQIDSNFTKGNNTSNDFYKFSRQYEKDISNLIFQRLNNKQKNQYYNNNSYNNFNNSSKNFRFINNENDLEKYRDFILKKNDETQIRLYSSKIIQSLENIKNKEEKKNFTKLNISNNYYFDKIINRVVRKVVYYSNKNEKFNEDLVMNMLFDEGKFLEIETNKEMELYCRIKNFSSVVLQNDYKKQLIPLINSVRPLTEADMKYMAEEIYKTQINYQKNPNYYNNLNNNINNFNLTNSNFFNKNNSNLSKDKNTKNIINLKSKLTLDDELPIGGGGIWDLYNKAHNIKKEGGPIKNFGITINDNRTTTYKYDENGNIIKNEQGSPININPNYTYTNGFLNKTSNKNLNQNQINQNEINQNEINQNQFNQNQFNQNQFNQNQFNQNQFNQNQFNQNQFKNNKSALNNFYKNAINNNNSYKNTIYNNTTNINSTNISYSQNGKLMKKLSSNENKTNDINISDEENINISKNKLIKREKTKEEINVKNNKTNEENNQKSKNKRNRNNSKNLKNNITSRKSKESKKSINENNDIENIKSKRKKKGKKNTKKEIESESEAYAINIYYK